MSSSTSTDLRDLNHGSFSFSCSESDLNFSSLSHFTDGDDDDESYIEIALDNHHGRDPKPAGRDDDVDDQGHDYVSGLDDHSEFLRISFSSSLLPEISNAAATSSVAPPCNLSSSSSSTESSCRGPVADECSSRHLPVSGSGKRGRLPAVNRQVNSLLFGHRSPSSELPTNADNADLAQSRKASNMRTSINGGIMKLLFKFRAMNLGALVSALVKPRQVAQEAHANSQRKKSKDSVSSTTTASANNRTLHEYHQKLVQKRQGKLGIKNKDSSDGGGEKSGRMLLEINLGAVKGVLEAIGNSMSTGVGRKDRRTMSCPSSIKSSPIHHQGFTSNEQSNRMCVYTRETSVQAAIAHCKTSLQH